MFQLACSTAAQYTRPVVMSVRQQNGKPQSGVASFIVLNSDGWAITAAHVFEPLGIYMQQQPEVQAHQAEVDRINATTVNNENLRRSRLKKLKPNPAWITDTAVWWGANGVTAASDQLYPAIDVALVRLNNHAALNVTEYPRFREPTALQAGTSLVKFGYPFTEVPTTFSKQGGFDLGSPELPIFPLEGIFTRGYHGDAVDGIPTEWVETSTPGLRGQSGGPVLDCDGVVCAMQSNTRHLLLGFNPEVKVAGRTTTEHQFLNVGVGVHPASLKAIFDKNGVAVQWES